jgi:DNA topoisomerase VI subunit A
VTRRSLKCQRTANMTLFDGDLVHNHPKLKDRGFPYSVAIPFLQGLDDDGFPEDEIDIFSDILSHEVSHYAPRGFVAGPIKVQVGRCRPTDLAVAPTPFQLPRWVEEDGLRFCDCDASGILLVDRWPTFSAFFDARIWDRLKLIVATGLGIPRATMRRFLHRVARTFHIPLYILTDNDTWGYFLFSVLKRGVLAPHLCCPYLAVAKVRYLGISSHELLATKMDNDQLRAWKPHWDLRLRCMEHYSCFQSNGWREEFASFRTQRVAIDLAAFLAGVGVEEFIEGYLRRKLQRRDWLT